MTNRLFLYGHDEVYVINLQQVLYIQADDHYAEVYYSAGSHFMVPYGLSRIEEHLASAGFDASYMQRLGRKYIVNCRRIFRITTVKEQIYLMDDSGSNVVLHIPKTVLRSFLEQMALMAPPQPASA